MPDRPRRLFVPELPSAASELELPVESARHAHVLRLAPGAAIELFDGRGGEAPARIEQVTRDRVVCHVDARRQRPAPSFALHFVLGLPKAQKLEDVTRMLTELGVASLHVALCERSVPQPRGDASARMRRLERIALEACAQSGQARVPTLHAPAPLLEIAARAPAAAPKLVFYERAESSLASAWHEPAPRDVWGIVGPEGGFEAREVEALRELGARVVGLGPALLRVETAAPVVAALLLARMGAFSPEPAVGD